MGANGAERLQLAGCLQAAAEQGDDRGIFAGHVPRGHAAGRSGSKLAEAVGLHDTERRSALDVIQVDEESARSADDGVGLETAHTQTVGGGLHPRLVRAGARVVVSTGPVGRIAAGLQPQHLLDCGDGLLNAEEPVDVRVGQK